MAKQGFIKKHWEKLIPLVILVIGAWVTYTNLYRFPPSYNPSNILTALFYIIIPFGLYLILKIIKEN